MDRNNLKLSVLKKYLEYWPELGTFIWKERNSNRKKVGSIAGHRAESGYIFIRINGESFSAHRLAWFYMTGKWPKDQIDHINGIRMDNSWCNLREATQKQNSANMSRHKDNKSGYIGVHRHKDRWRAQISHSGERMHLGIFFDPESAARAYDTMALIIHGKFAKLNFKGGYYRQEK